MKTSSWYISIYVFLQFLRRDIYVHTKYIKDYIINYSVLYPCIFAFAFAYLQANTYFGHNNQTLGTILFCGNILVIMMVITYKQTISLLFDLEGDRFIDYQICMLSPRLVLLERIIFTSLFCFVLSLPFFPVAKLFLYSYIDTSNTHWLSVLLILYLGSLCCSAYHQLATLILKRTNQIGSLWARVNHGLINFGGFWIPLYIMYQFSPLLGTILYLNPLIYISEGLRQAVIGGTLFLLLWQCTAVLTIYSIIFILLCWYFFKKRVDHI